MAIQATQQTRYQDDFPHFEIPEVERLDDPVFFVQFVDDVHDTDTLAIPKLYRGVVTPCQSFLERRPLVEIRDADLVKGTKEADRQTGRDFYGKVQRHAKIEADRLVELERHAEYKLGIVEVTALRSLPNLYRRRINSLFYSGLDWETVETNEAMLAYLQSRLASLRSDPPSELSAAEFEGLVNVGEELIAACQYADRIQRSHIDRIHAMMKLPATDAGSLAGKTEHESFWKYRLFLKRTGLKALSETDQQLAGALERLSNSQGGDPEIKELLKTMNSLLGVLVAERTEPKSKGGK